MDNNNYIQIQGWMINELGLKSNELISYAIIYGFSQDGNSEFTGSINYICKSLKCSRPTAINTLRNLTEKGLVIKTEFTVNNVNFNKYKIILGVVKNFYGGSKETLRGGSKETLPNNTNNNNTKESKEETPSLLVKKESTKAKLFSDSIYFNYETLRDYLIKDEKFKKDYAGVDLKFYISKAEMWSENNPTKKRTDRGWLLTLRDWMRQANENKELKLLENKKNLNNGFTNH
jgi:DNA-binding Lrp family transcriptional regulator